MVVIGTAYFFILLDRMNLQIILLNSLITLALLALTLAPTLLTFTSDNSSYNSFPPYWPPYIKSLGQNARPDEWVTSDMPWATAWYADRASLWLPDSMSDFENFNKTLCPTGLLLLTPVTWSEPISNFTTGEDKDWAPLVFFTGDFIAPADFPLTAHSKTGPGGPEYSIWSDRARWQEK
jgi:hypothetical protein